MPATPSNPVIAQDARTRASHALLARFDATPTHTAQAPGRINLIGEHTDYNGGLVLPTPIRLHCVAAGGIAKGSESRLLAADLNEFFAFNPAQDLTTYLDTKSGIPRGHWASYILGVLHGYRKAGFDIPPLDISVASDIPIGAGLSSSAALEAATANLIESITGRALLPLDKARLCRTAEHTFAGVPCGIMDQYAVILGKPGQALLIDCGKETSKLVPLPPRDKAVILVIDTMVRHKLASSEYAQRRAVCASAAAKMGVPLLCRAGFSSFGTNMTEEESRLAFYVMTECARVVVMDMALSGGNLPFAGKLMFESHEDLRLDYRVSCPELDTIVDLARTIPGVYGARMTGAGFGGCAIALMDPNALEAATRQITDGFTKAHGHACRTFVATA